MRKQQRKKYSPKLLEKMLQDSVSSYNDTINRSHKMTPRQANNPMLDPYLRKIQFPAEPLLPFDEFYVEELGRQKKANTPDPRARKNMDESPDNYRVGKYEVLLAQKQL